MSDKEGGFVVMEKGMFLAKAKDALKKNFVLTQANLAKVKRESLRMCDEMNLPKLRKDLVGAKRDALEMFYTAKTHKEEVPFRAIVTEKGSWQGVLSRFLQKQLNGLHLGDPFLVRNSDEVVGFFSELQAAGGGILAFSIEADMFYSIPKNGIMCAVQERIDEKGAVSFQNSAGMSSDNFMSLLDYYLSSTVVRSHGNLVMQKRGVCIGSCIAPVLSDLFLAKCDRQISCRLKDTSVIKVCRYMDDFLVMEYVEHDDRGRMVVDVLRIFAECAEGLKFTHEMPESVFLQFLTCACSLVMVCRPPLRASVNRLINRQAVMETEPLATLLFVASSGPAQATGHPCSDLGSSGSSLPPRQVSPMVIPSDQPLPDDADMSDLSDSSSATVIYGNETVLSLEKSKPFEPVIPAKRGRGSKRVYRPHDVSTIASPLRHGVVVVIKPVDFSKDITRYNPIAVKEGLETLAPDGVL
ncbi:hypothetical protein HPB48_003527 [Haemaphysalis longicornis]|uniref:Tick transposon n=1 Tax=Haemaphysalis longicornis TaxID=44386 RepID=A0A9J6GCB9_HAELO|nr:hypothetical protein HPB48_003527 [Haemaphysalis longicornis]